MVQNDERAMRSLTPFRRRGPLGVLLMALVPVSFALAAAPDGRPLRDSPATVGDGPVGPLVGTGTVPIPPASTEVVEPQAGRRSAQEALEGWGDFVRASMERWNVPGVAMAIVMDGEVVLAEGYGQRDVEGGLPVTAETAFPIGSASKAFTGLLVSLLVEEGKLAWDEPVTTWLPDFELQDPHASDEINPEDLLTHRSGLPRHDLLWYGSPFDRESLVHRVRYLEPSAPFRTDFQYQNLMYVTAGYLAGRVAGSTWEEQIRDRIFEPLGMAASTLRIDDMLATNENHAFGYRDVDDDESDTTGQAGALSGSRPHQPRSMPPGAAADSVARMEFRRIDAVGPAGSINSTVLDMARWVEAQLGTGAVDGEEVFPPAAVRKTQAPEVVVDEGIFSTLLAQPELPHLMYGLGWFLQPYRGHRMLHHGGNIDGFTSVVSFLPDDGTGLVVLTNMNSTFLTTVLALSLYDRLLGLEPVDWNERYEGIRDRLEAAQEQQGAGSEPVTGTSPSHALEDYVAAYTHPGYGRLDVTGGPEGLAIRYHVISMPLEHVHYDVFEGKGEPPLDDLRLRLQFQSNLDGHIDRISVPLQGGVDPIVFRRQPPDSLSEATYLRAFEGDYDVMGNVASVSLREDALVLTVPGQPAYTLVPTRVNEFSVEGQEGFSVRFVREGGRVTAMLLVQPGGTLRAERRP